MWKPLYEKVVKRLPKRPVLQEARIKSYPVYESEDKQKAGWVSHTYTQSRAVLLDSFALAARRCVAALPNSRETEPYKILRTQILQRTEKDQGTTIMITSALPGEGKTLTAINLAFTFAREFSQTALLVDCDFKRQAIHGTLGIESGKGLLDYLINDEPVPDLIVWPGVEKLTLISGGGTINESTEYLGSPKMKALVQDMKNRYPERYVFFDVPPLLTSADALTFAPFVDFVILVVAAGVTPIPEVKRALELIPPEKALGLILNRSTSGKQGSYY